ncbi:MAG TPA: protoporphyrinogen oxidase [Intrasporangiaceae bacterium]|nr:protoporphyrinogen oxidase [Intrasporangiaceae bacterium]
MGKLSFLAGAAVGYVLGARAGVQRYEQIKALSNKVWTSDPVQQQVEKEEAARTQLAPTVADAVSTAAKATADKLRSEKTVPSEAVEPTMEARVETAEAIHEGDPLEPPAPTTTAP